MFFTLRFFSSKCSLFHNSNVFCSCILPFYIQGVLKLKKNNSGAKSLNNHTVMHLAIINPILVLDYDVKNYV